MEKGKFSNLIDRFYSDGLMKKVYETDNTLVCNMFNQFYIAFDSSLVSRCEDKGMFPGFITNSAGLKRILEDDRYMAKRYALLSPEEQDAELKFVDEKLHSSLLGKKDSLSRKPVPAHMDLAFEQQVIAMQNNKGELASMLEEQQAQSLAAAQQKGVPSQK